jgi:hypothetical protein
VWRNDEAAASSPFTVQPPIGENDQSVLLELLPLSTLDNHICSKGFYRSTKDLGYEELTCSYYFEGFKRIP